MIDATKLQDALDLHKCLTQIDRDIESANLMCAMHESRVSVAWGVGGIGLSVSATARVLEILKEDLVKRRQDCMAQLLEMGVRP